MNSAAFLCNTSWFTRRFTTIRPCATVTTCFTTIQESRRWTMTVATCFTCMSHNLVISPITQRAILEAFVVFSTTVIYPPGHEKENGLRTHPGSSVPIMPSVSNQILDISVVHKRDQNSETHLLDRRMLPPIAKGSALHRKLTIEPEQQATDTRTNKHLQPRKGNAFRQQSTNQC